MARAKKDFPQLDVDVDVFDSLSTAVLLLDADLNVLNVNAAACSLFATSVARINAVSLVKLLPGADELIAAARRAMLEQRQFTEHGLDLRLVAAGHTLVDCNVTPIWRQGPSPDRVLIELTRVDRHRRIQLDDNLMMQNQASSALLHGLAHEIKNPLGGIRGAAQLLERELEDQRLAEYTQVIIGEADRLRSLVENMFGPRGETHRVMLNIHDVLEHVRLIVDAERGGCARIERDYDPSLPECCGDRDQLIQAFLNLLRNAMAAVNVGGGSVTIRTRVQRKYTIGSTLHRLVARIQIIDTGPGVDPELGSSIFFPLVSGHKQGSGLGLPIAQSLIHRQGGMIGFESIPGHTDFSVWLPLGDNS